MKVTEVSKPLGHSSFPTMFFINAPLKTFKNSNYVSFLDGCLKQRNLKGFFILQYFFSNAKQIISYI